ncbi:uncharacterized protein [Drosophila pseudoobscura]|uniref:Uncharacterized protein isoform X2 n=1 Tax=Drosophila pseudoobscura pseudoobscura TaxID=46245 RepID=A0A6I8UKY5_DROPS|nr:uncharacterized protein LOC4817800 isoform X2 [Drosophila pseudoobscura]
MDSLPDICDLGHVIEPHLSGGSLRSYQTNSLTQPGDNYGSVLLSIRAQVLRPDGELYEKNLVAKVPPTDPKFWQFIQPERTCLTENAVYKILAPALATLQEEAGIPQAANFDGFARYYGSRTSLDPSCQLVDKHAILVLENLRSSHYVPGQRLQPYDLSHTLMALTYMAQFHALPLALRLLKPHFFQEQIKPFFEKFDWHAAAPESKAIMKAETLEDIRKATNNNEELISRVKKLSDEFFDFLAAPSNMPDGQFTSIIHSDFWINNLMFQYGPSGTPTHMKIIDFQTAQYDSVAHDIISFLLSSVDMPILELHFEHMLEVYYKEFISCLDRVGAEVSGYSYEAFRAEVKRVAYIQVPHAIFMTRFILAENVNVTTEQKEHHQLAELLKNTGSERICHRLNQILNIAQQLDILY